MKKHSLASKILWIAFAVFLLGAILLGSMAVLKEYEKTANYFIPDAILAPITVILGTIAISCGVAAVCTTKRTDLSENIFPDNHHFPLTAIGFFGAAVLLLLSFTSVLALIALPFLILASAYCILTGSAKSRKNANTVSLLGFSAVLGTILLNAYYYFDFTVEMNAPIKVALQLGLLTMMLCYTSELRYLLGIQKPKMYLILSVIGIACASVTSIPICIAAFTGKFTRLDYTASAILIFIFALMQCARVIYLLRGIKAESKEEESTQSLAEDVSEPTEQSDHISDEEKEGTDR